MEPLFERAAKAAADRWSELSGYLSPGWATASAQYRNDWRKVVRAAIEALREADESVIEAVQVEVDIWPEDKPRPSPSFVQFVSRDEAAAIWEAGIEALLAEVP